MEPPTVPPEELILEILSFLPVKPLVRFKCVSKSWNSTISDSQFIKLHLHRSCSRRNTDFVAYFRSLVNRSASATTPIRIPDEYKFSGTFDGLICLLKREENFVRIRLWNPATRSMSQHSPPLHFSNTGLGFEFGYDCSSETYKVVVVTRSVFASRGTTVNVYNNGDTCWRRLQVFPRGTYPISNAVNVSNTLNWLAILPDVLHGYSATEQMNSDAFIIFSFDLGKENYAQLSLPYCPRCIYEIREFMPALGVLKDCLCLCYTEKKLHFAIWQMKEFGVHNSWTLLFNITTGYEFFLAIIFTGPVLQCTCLRMTISCCQNMVCPNPKQFSIPRKTIN
ncbi:F-box protein CPR1-like [Lotus japonicus]|uniref:F-box protein CPR1-like n=1 Tax=Lotus japonicus TaxID=34305 RepID=UPI00258DFFF9|nr:F-box protein CPR1-like [Lotus japonicus]